MKKTILIIIAALPALLFAQTVERQVIGSAGNWAVATGVQVSSTVGEPVTTTATAASVILTQGFQQSGGGTVGIKDLETGLSVNAFPNPAKNLVMLELNTPNAMELTVSVFDVSGRLTSVPVQKLNISGESSHAIDFSAMAAGNYYIKLTNSDNKLNQTIKIQKVD